MLQSLVELSLQEQAFLIVVALVGILLIVSVAFAVVTMIFRRRNEEKARRWKRLEEAWEPVLLDVLSGDASPDDLWSRVDPEDELFFIDFLQDYTHLVRGEERKIVEKLAQPYLHRIVKRTEFEEAGIRARAIQTLAILAFDEYEELVVDGLDDPSPLVAVVAARHLGESGAPKHATALLEHLERYELWTSDYVAEMLASMGAPVVPELVLIYRDTEVRPEVRAIAAQALGQIEAPGTADEAAEVLEEVSRRIFSEDSAGQHEVVEPGEETPEVAEYGGERELLIASLRLLSRIGHPRHVPLIRPLADSDDPVFRAMAITALGEIGREADVDRLREALQDPSPWVALHAAQGLRSLKVIGDLEEMAESEGPRSELAREVLGS